MNHEEDIEFAPKDAIVRYQEKLLVEQLAYLNRCSRFYRRMFRQQGIDISRIQHLTDLCDIPFTDKGDLLKYNEDFLCCSRDKVIDYVTTSGTLGEPVVFCCSERDLERLAYNEYKSFSSAGVDKNSIVQLMVTLDKRFMAGMAYFNGLRKLGAGVVRVGGGLAALQWDTIERLRPDTLMCVPSFIPHLIEYAEQHNIDYRNSSVRRIIGIGEGLHNIDASYNLLGERIHQLWEGVELFATYSSTEMSTTFPECSFHCGGHVHPELIIVEIVDELGRVVSDGEVGEVVVTTLGVEAMPLLRFRTGDMATKIDAPCQCGRNSYRLSPIVGRKNHMIKLKGTTLYPPAFFDVLNDASYVENYVVVVRSSTYGTDEVIVRVGLRLHSHENLDGNWQSDKEVIEDLQERFRSRLRVTPLVEVLPVDVIQTINYPSMSRKIVNFIDERSRENIKM